MWARLFGSQQEEPKAGAPALSDATAQLELKVKNLEATIAKEEEEIRRLVERSSRDPTAKRRALEVMKRKKNHEQSRDQLMATQFNLETMSFEQEKMEITAMAVQAMKAGQEAQKAMMKNISPEAVEELMDQISDSRAQMQETSEALARTTGTGIDQDELDAEFAQLEEQIATEKLAGLGAASPSAVPQRPAVPEQAGLEEEFARLQAQMATPAPAAPSLTPA